MTLFVGVTTSAYRSWQDVLWRGAAAIVLADLLERHGYQVELWGVQNVAHAYRNGQSMIQGVCLKRADQPIDASTLVNALSGWFYRTVCFQAYYVEDVAPSTGLGRPVPLSSENQFVKEHTGNGKAVVVDSIWSEAEAVRFVLNAVHDL